jgi:hypothetical protein
MVRVCCNSDAVAGVVEARMTSGRNAMRSFPKRSMDAVRSRPADVDPNVLSLDPSEFLKLLPKSRNEGLCLNIAVGKRHQHANPPVFALLRSYAQWPRRRRTHKCNELPPPHTFGPIAAQGNAGKISGPNVHDMRCEIECCVATGREFSCVAATAHWGSYGCREQLRDPTCHATTPAVSLSNAASPLTNLFLTLRPPFMLVEPKMLSRAKSAQTSGKADVLSTALSYRQVEEFARKVRWEVRCDDPRAHRSRCLDGRYKPGAGVIGPRSSGGTPR